MFLPGKSHGHTRLEGYSPWGCKESDTTEQLTLILWDAENHYKDFRHWRLAKLVSLGTAFATGTTGRCAWSSISTFPDSLVDGGRAELLTGDGNF